MPRSLSDVFRPCFVAAGPRVQNACDFLARIGLLWIAAAPFVVELDDAGEQRVCVAAGVPVLLLRAERE